MNKVDKYLQIESLILVIVGEFNPVIFQPFWLSSKNLIREDEATKAKIEIIHNEIVRYELQDWLSFEVTRNRCMLKTSKEPYFEPLKDLAIGIFKFLRETPINSIGINNHYELSLLSEDNYYKFGSKLTPLDYWSDSLNDPRLLNIEIYDQERKLNSNASRSIRIIPSEQIKTFGVSVNINNHFKLDSNDKASTLSAIIETNWDSSFSQSKELVENLLSKIDL